MWNKLEYCIAYNRISCYKNLISKKCHATCVLFIVTFFSANQITRAKTGYPVFRKFGFERVNICHEYVILTNFTILNFSGGQSVKYKISYDFFWTKLLNTYSCMIFRGQIC